VKFANADGLVARSRVPSPMMCGSVDSRSVKNGQKLTSFAGRVTCILLDSGFASGGFIGHTNRELVGGAKNSG
jgi:hypothetical protein